MLSAPGASAGALVPRRRRAAGRCPGPWQCGQPKCACQGAPRSCPPAGAAPAASSKGIHAHTAPSHRELAQRAPVPLAFWSLPSPADSSRVFSSRTCAQPASQPASHTHTQCAQTASHAYTHRAAAGGLCAAQDKACHFLQGPTRVLRSNRRRRRGRATSWQQLPPRPARAAAPPCPALPLWRGRLCQ